MSAIVARNLPLPLFTNEAMGMLFIDHCDNGLTLDATIGTVGNPVRRPVLRMQLDYKGKPIIDCQIYDDDKRNSIYKIFMEKISLLRDAAETNQLRQALKDELIEMAFTFALNYAEVSKTEIMMMLLTRAYEKGHVSGRYELRSVIRSSLKVQNF